MNSNMSNMSSFQLEKTNQICFQQARKLGEGMYGKVYSVKDENDNNLVIKRSIVPKILRNTSANVRELDQLLICQGHPFCVRLECNYFNSPLNPATMSPIADKRYTDDSIFFALEQGDMDLLKWMQDNTDNIHDKKMMMCHMLLAVEFLASKGIAHRDIKPENIIVFRHSISADDDGAGSNQTDDNIETTFKLADFGFSGFTKKMLLTNVALTTVFYRAPEICMWAKHDSKVDVWSLGSLFFEIWSQGHITLYKQRIGHNKEGKKVKLPPTNRQIIEDLSHIFEFSKMDYTRAKSFYHNNVLKLADRPTTNLLTLMGWSQERINFINSHCLTASDDVKNLLSLLSGMLTVDPTRRMSASQALNHPYFNFCRELIQNTRADFGLNDDGLALIKPVLLMPLNDDHNRSLVMKFFEEIYQLRQQELRQRIEEGKEHRYRDERFQWFELLIWFHAVNIYDRCGLVIDDEYQAYMLVITCIYISCKYFRILKPHIDLDKFHYRFTDAISIEEFRRYISELEITILSECVNLIYEETLYELMDLDHDSDWLPVIELVLSGNYLAADTVHGQGNKTIAITVQAVAERCYTDIKQRKLLTGLALPPPSSSASNGNGNNGNGSNGNGSSTVNSNATINSASSTAGRRMSSPAGTGRTSDRLTRRRESSLLV